MKQGLQTLLVTTEKEIATHQTSSISKRCTCFPSWTMLSATLLNSLACNARYILETIHSPTVAEGWTYKVATMIISFGKLASEYQRS
jgi:hypothetical protein